MPKYEGGCHCGKVRYEVDLTIGKVLSCNCSICTKKGHLLAFTPESTFKLVKGQEALSDYQFNKHIIHHLFCYNCGVGSYAQAVAPDGTKMIAINVRCLDGIDVDTLEIQKFDGKSR